MNVPSIAYVTPVLHYDAEARVTVIQYRDTDTGQVTRQIPDEKALKQRLDADAVAEARTATAVGKSAVSLEA
jgi:hypothetical protein